MKQVRNRLKVLILSSLCVAALAIIPSRPTEAAIEHDIHRDGSALFYAVVGARRIPVWSVSCRVFLRGCMARGDGIVLRLDADNNPRLLVACSGNGRISILRRNFREDADHITSQPLAEPSIERMSGPDAFLVVEEPDASPVYIRTVGLNAVIGYLRWLDSAPARVLRDARLWPEDGALDLQAAGDEALDRFRLMELRDAAGPRYLVPSTKPQIEFAIRAQGGVSIFPVEGE